MSFRTLKKRECEIEAQDSAYTIENEALDARRDALAPERRERIQKRLQEEDKEEENERKKKVSEMCEKKNAGC